MRRRASAAWRAFTRARRAAGRLGQPERRGDFQPEQVGSVAGTPVRSTNHAPSSKLARAASATATARRVLPTPPGPISVSNGRCCSVSARTSRRISSARPISASGSSGKLSWDGTCTVRRQAPRVLCGQLAQSSSVWPRPPPGRPRTARPRSGGRREEAQRAGKQRSADRSETSRLQLHPAAVDDRGDPGHPGLVCSSNLTVGRARGFQTNERLHRDPGRAHRRHRPAAASKSSI